MEEIIKLRCPHCDGKVSLDESFYKELVGKSIDCPHCSEAMKIPSTIKNISEDLGAHFLRNSRIATQKVSTPVSGWPAPPIRTSGPEDKPVYCPKCKEEIGRRDLVCISCGNKLTPVDPPPNF